MSGALSDFERHNITAAVASATAGVACHACVIPGVGDGRVVYDDCRLTFDLFIADDMFIAGLRCCRIRVIHSKIDRAWHFVVS